MSGPPSQPPPLAQGQHPHPPQPQLAPGQQQLEAALLGLFQSLTELQTVAGSVVPGSEALVSSAAERTIADLSRLSLMKPSITGGVHPTVLELVEQDKNPHSFTRDTLERASGENQFAHGKLQALGSYTDLLDAQLEDAFPDLKGLLRPSPIASASAPSSDPSSAGAGAGPAAQGSSQPLGAQGPPGSQGEGGDTKMDWSA